ncbi:MAG: VOC family protein [Dehalococcoidia bacterium]
MEVTKAGVDLGLLVRDVQACLKFYCEDLGWPKVGVVEFPGGRRQHRVQVGDTLLKLMEFDEGAPPLGPRGRMAQAGIRYFTVTVRNLEGVMKDLEAKGHTFVLPLTKSPTGNMVCMVEDPEGNTVELLEPAP